MRGKLLFLGGLAAGFVLGARAGREKYEELLQAARKVKENPTVQEAAGVVQEQASRLMSSGREMVTEKLGNSRFAETPIGEKVLSAMDTDAGARAIKKSEVDDTLATSGTTTAGRTTSNTTGSSGTTTGSSY